MHVIIAYLDILSRHREWHSSIGCSCVFVRQLIHLLQYARHWICQRIHPTTNAFLSSNLLLLEPIFPNSTALSLEQGWGMIWIGRDNSHFWLEMDGENEIGNYQFLSIVLSFIFDKVSCNFFLGFRLSSYLLSGRSLLCLSSSISETLTVLRDRVTRPTIDDLGRSVITLKCVI